MRRLTNPRSVARAIRDVIEAEDHWNQSLWISADFFADDDEIQTGTGLRNVMNRNVCGTTACVAGHAIILTLPAKGKYDYLHDSVVKADGTRIDVSKYAQSALNLTDDEAAWLFDANRDKKEVLAALDLIIKGQRLDPILTHN